MHIFGFIFMFLDWWLYNKLKPQDETFIGLQSVRFQAASDANAILSPIDVTSQNQVLAKFDKNMNQNAESSAIVAFYCCFEK